VEPQVVAAPQVTVERDGPVAVLELRDPARRNALSPGLSTALADAVAGALAAGARAIALTAAPPVFCAGGSLDDLASGRVDLDAAYAGPLALAEAPVPTIAAVDGPCVGAGVNLPLACDVVVCTPRAVFDPRWLDVGIHPGGGHLWRMRERIGAQATAATVLFGEKLGGAEAVARGLAWRCVAEDELREVVLALAHRAAGRDLELVRRTKRSLRAAASVADARSAADLERGAQVWSMGRPEFAERVAEMRRVVAERAVRGR
jgi:enoyl-CoA hydratase